MIWVKTTAHSLEYNEEMRADLGIRFVTGAKYDKVSEILMKLTLASHIGARVEG